MIKYATLFVIGLIACSDSHGSDEACDRDECRKGIEAAPKSDAATDSGAAEGGSGATVAECDELRSCCNAMAGADRGTCLATLASIETGKRPAADCSSALDGLVEDGSCGCPSATCSCGMMSCTTGELCRDGRCAGAAPADAGPPDSGTTPRECAEVGDPCVRNVACCGWTAGQAFCVSVLDEEVCLKSCKDSADCPADQGCMPLSIGSSVCVP